MSPFLTHLGLGSIGLLLAVALGQLLLWFWRRRPLASYRLFCALLFGALLLPLAQVGMEHWSPVRELALVQRLADVRASLEPVAARSGEVEPDPLAELSSAELATLMRVLAEEPAAPGSVVSESRLTPGVLARIPGGLAGLLAAAYAAGVLWALVRLGRRLARTHALVRDAEPVADPVVRGVWGELVTASRLGPRLELLASRAVQAPVCFGLRRKVILIPATPGASPSARWEPDVLRCVLLHELVHLERRDTWVMLVQEFFRAVFWFHPAAWFLCRKLDALRELSCDLLVVQRTGHRKRYAQALLEYAAWMKRVIPSPSSTALLPWSGSKSQLSRRIEMLITLPSQRSFPWTTVPAAVSLITCLWGGQLAVAASLSPGEASQDGEPAAPAVAPAWPEPAREPAPLATPRPAPAPSPRPAASPSPDPMIARWPGLPAALPPAQDPREPDALESLRALGYVRQQQDTPMIGVYLGEDANSGLRINQVVPGSLAERQRLQPGDVIVSINGEPASRDLLEQAKRGMRTGVVVLGVRRGEEQLFFQFSDPNPSGHYPRLPGLESRPPEQAGGDEVDQARAALERALERNPDDAAVRRALEALRQARAPRSDPETRRGRALSELDRAREAQARGDYEAALNALRQLRELGAQGDANRGDQLREAARQRELYEVNRRRAPEQPRLYPEQPRLYPEQPRPYPEQQRLYPEREPQPESQARRRALEAELRSTEAQLQERMRELEALRARIRDLREQGTRGSGSRSSGVRSSGGRGAGPSAGPGASRGAGPSAGPGPGPSGPSAGPGPGPSGIGGAGRRIGAVEAPRADEPANESADEPIGQSIARELAELGLAPPAEIAPEPAAPKAKSGGVK